MLEAGEALKQICKLSKEIADLEVLTVLTCVNAVRPVVSSSKSPLSYWIMWDHSGLVQLNGHYDSYKRRALFVE